LHQTGLQPIDREGLHKLTNQDVIKIVWHSPQEEERSN
jgi:hypothetical protein